VDGLRGNFGSLETDGALVVGFGLGEIIMTLTITMGTGFLNVILQPP
jgi:hypothetical protein